MATKTPGQIIEQVQYWFPTNYRMEITAERQRQALFEILILSGTTAVDGIGNNVPPVITPDAAYVVGTAPVGPWAGQPNKIAYEVSGEWQFFPLVSMGFDYDGIMVWDRVADQVYVWTGTAWVPETSGGNLVTSVFGRIGDVVANLGDYGTDLVTNESAVTGATLTQALNALLASSGTVSDGTYGQITVSGLGSVWTIEASSVTFSQVQNIATQRLLGRYTAGTGSIETLTIDPTLVLTGAGVLERAGLTGDASAAAGSNTLTLATVNGDVGTFGDATHVSRVTVNGKGLITAASAVAITYPPVVVPDGSYGDINVAGSGLVWTIAANAVDFSKFQQVTTDTLLGRDTAGTGNIESIALNATLSMDGSQHLQRAALTGDITAAAGSNSTTLATVNSNVGTFGDSTHVGVFTVNGKGLVTAASSVLIAGVAPADGDYGDITVSSGGTVWTIDPNVVTFAKFQQIATDSLLGRDTAGTGNVENIGLNATLSMDGSGNLQRAALTGDISAAAGSNITAIGANKVLDTMLRQGVARSIIGVTGNATANEADIQGTTDQVLRVNGAGTALAFGAIDLSKSAAAGGVLQAASFPALTGDLTTVAGALASTLATVNSNVGSFGDGTHVGAFTVNAKGLITAASSVAITFPTVAPVNAQYLVAAADGTLTAERVATDTATISWDFGTAAQGKANVVDNSISNAKLRQGAARSVIGVTGNSTANEADIQGTTDQVLRINGAGTALAFGAIDLSKSAAAGGVLQAASFPALTGDVTTVAGALAATIANDAVTNAKLANMATQTIKGRTTAGTGDPEDLTPTQAGAIIGSSGPWVLKVGDTMSGALIHPDGSAALPSVGVGGTTEGIYGVAGQNAVGFSINAGAYTFELNDTTVNTLQFRGTQAIFQAISSGGNAIFDFVLYRNAANNPVIKVTKGRGTELVPLVVATLDTCGAFESWAYNGSALTRAGLQATRITAAVPSNTDMQSQEAFFTIPAASVTLTETFDFDLVSGLMYGSAKSVFLDTNRLFQLRSTSLAGALTGAAGKLAYFTDADGYPVFHNGTNYQLLGNGSQQTIATDAAFTLTTMTSQVNVKHTGTLTANRLITLSTTNAYKGARFSITRTGAGAFNLDVGGLKNLITNTWCEVTYDGSAWYLSKYGAL